MTEIEGLVIPVIISIIITSIFSIFFMRKDKIDKGFAINYYKLSYRRKLIRTLTSFPLLLVASILIIIYTEINSEVLSTYGVIIYSLFLLQLLYNYINWKKKECGS